MKSIVNDFQLSKYFNLRDFQCKCGCNQVKLSPTLLEVCESLRSHIPFRINSGYRCLAHNKKVGGAKNSYHLKGLAVDSRSTFNSLENLFTLASAFSEINGLGIYESGIVHIDLREGKRIFWVKLEGKDYMYFSNPDSALKCWRLNIG